MPSSTRGFQASPAVEPVGELIDEALALVSRVNDRLRSSTERFTNASRPHNDAASREVNARVEREKAD